MSDRQGPAFDFTRLAKWTALLFPAYFIGIPALGIPIAIVYFVNHTVGLALLDVWRWVPAIFPLAALVLVVDLWSHLSVLRPSQVVGHRAAGVCLVAAGAFGLSFNHLWALPVATAVLCCALMLTPRSRALGAEDVPLLQESGSS